MFNCEVQNFMFFGNGIVILYGIIDICLLVKQIGVVVYYFFLGVDWGDGNMVYVVIGIVVKLDEYLGIFK